MPSTEIELYREPNIAAVDAVTDVESVVEQDGLLEHLQSFRALYGAVEESVDGGQRVQVSLDPEMYDGIRINIFADDESENATRGNPMTVFDEQGNRIDIYPVQYDEKGVQDTGRLGSVVTVTTDMESALTETHNYQLFPGGRVVEARAGGTALFEGDELLEVREGGPIELEAHEIDELTELLLAGE